MSKMDAFTVKTLLSALANGASQDDVADLYKQFNEHEGGPTEESVKFFNDNEGKLVSIEGNIGLRGTVVALNTSTSGLYPGYMFPIYVDLENGKGRYEYTLSQLKVVEK